jgi:hypothetical protein
MCFCLFVCFSVITQFFSLAILSGPTLLISCIAYCNNLNHFYSSDSSTPTFLEGGDKVLVLLLIDD